MARTAVTVTTLTPGTGVTTPAGTTADPTNGHVVTLPAGAQLEELVIRITNTNGTNRVATVKAGGNPPALAAGQGDLAVTVPATTGDITIGGLESARFLQSDGTLNIDLAASLAGVVSAVYVSRKV